MDKIDLAGLIGCMIGFICGAGLMAVVGIYFKIVWVAADFRSFGAVW